MVTPSVREKCVAVESYQKASGGSTPGTGLPGPQAAVDDQVLSRHVRRRIRSQIQDGSADFVLLRHAPQRNPAAVVLHEGIVLAAEDASLSDRIYADAPRPPL